MAPPPWPLVFGTKIVGGSRMTVPVGDMTDSTYLPSGHPISVKKLRGTKPHLRELGYITFGYCQACYCDEN